MATVPDNARGWPGGHGDAPRPARIGEALRQLRGRSPNAPAPSAGGNGDKA